MDGSWICKRRLLVRREPHQMRGVELRLTKQELEDRLRSSQDDHERQELRRRIDELEVEIRRRSSIGQTGRSPSDRDASSSGDRAADHPSETE